MFTLIRFSIISILSELIEVLYAACESINKSLTPSLIKKIKYISDNINLNLHLNINIKINYR